MRAVPQCDEMKEYRETLTEDQKAIYWEAIDCGATHNDAMEAASTNGYTS